MKYTENEKNIIKDLKQLCYEVSREDNLFNYDNYSPSEIMTMVDNVLNLVKKLQKEIERLEKTIDENIVIEPDETGCHEELNIHIKDFIPKDTIKEKMKQLEITDCTIRYDKYDIQDILKELLGE